LPDGFVMQFFSGVGSLTAQAKPARTRWAA
jgi:hypothetical protein